MKTHAGLGPDTLVPRVVSAALKQLQVGAEEGFVLSRVDGNTTVGEICLLVPFDADVTVTILKALRRMGAIDVPGAQPMVAEPAPSAAARKATPAAGTATAASRPAPTAAAPRASTPAAGIATPRATTPAAGTAATAARKTTPAAGIAAAAPATIATTAPTTTAAAPSPLVAGLELTIDQAERIDGYFASLDDKDAFELLEVTRAADKRAIKRAYFKLSKEFHPDRFFGQNIGPYKERLSRIFQSVKAAFELLSDDTRRAAYEQSTQEK